MARKDTIKRLLSQIDLTNKQITLESNPENKTALENDNKSTWVIVEQIKKEIKAIEDGYFK